MQQRFELAKSKRQGLEVWILTDRRTNVSYMFMSKEGARVKAYQILNKEAALNVA